MSSSDIIEDLRMLSPPNYAGWWFAAVAALLAVGIFLVLRRKRGTQGLRGEAALGLSPWELALAELERLLPLLNRGYSRDYSIASTKILRHYIEQRYGILAPKLATEEFLKSCGESAVIPNAHRPSLQRYLDACDLMKFGRYTASAGELESLHEAAVEFVLASRPQEPTPGAS